MASPMMADFGDHKYVEKFTLKFNIKRSQSDQIDVMIYLDNLGDKESEKPKRRMCTSWLP